MEGFVYYAVRIAPFVFFILYTVGLYYCVRRLRWRFSKACTERLVQVHVLLAVLSVMIVALYAIWGFTLRGGFMDRLVIIAFLFTGVCIYPLGSWPLRATFALGYFRIFSFLPMVFGAIGMIPYIGMIIFMSLTIKLFVPFSHTYYNDEHLSIVSKFSGPLAPLNVVVNEKIGPFNREIPLEGHSQHHRAEYAEVRYEQDSTKIFFYAAEDSTVTSSISIQKVAP